MKNLALCGGNNIIFIRFNQKKKNEEAETPQKAQLNLELKLNV